LTKPSDDDAAKWADALAALLPCAQYDALQPIKVGMSGAGVFSDAAARQVLKVDHVDSPNALSRERDVMQRLRGVLPVPEVVRYETRDGIALLWMSAIDGLDASQCAFLEQPERLCAVYADALRRIHALPLTTMRGFERGLDVLIPEALRRLKAGQVDLDDLDDGRDAGALERDLLANRPVDEDMCVTHGDYCLPNLMLSPDTWTINGYIDLGRFGISDRWNDLGIAARTIAYNIGEQHIPAFFRAYGIAPDHAKIAYYQLVDELF
jgi:aminoglycoside 3'-phosphotransferase II